MVIRIEPVLEGITKILQACSHVDCSFSDLIRKLMHRSPQLFIWEEKVTSPDNSLLLTSHCKLIHMRDRRSGGLISILSFKSPMKRWLYYSYVQVEKVSSWSRLEGFIFLFHSYFAVLSNTTEISWLVVYVTCFLSWWFFVSVWTNNFTRRPSYG